MARRKTLMAVQAAHTAERGVADPTVSMTESPYHAIVDPTKNALEA
jgi:hypothetical protein